MENKVPPTAKAVEGIYLCTLPVDGLDTVRPGRQGADGHVFVSNPIIAWTQPPSDPQPMQCAGAFRSRERESKELRYCIATHCTDDEPLGTAPVVAILLAAALLLGLLRHFCHLPQCRYVDMSICRYVDLARGRGARGTWFKCGYADYSSQKRTASMRRDSPVDPSA